MDQLPKRGDRVRLIRMNDTYPVESGTLGTVVRVRSESILMDWDNGRKLALIPEEDEWEIVT